MPQFTLENVFKLEACSIHHSIDASQLRNLLVMEGQKHFDKLLVADLVDEFGAGGLVNFIQFSRIWIYLQKIREPFELYHKNGLVSPKKFAKFLEIRLQTRLNKGTICSLLTYYQSELTFDVCVHALRRLSELSEIYDLSETAIPYSFYKKIVHLPVEPSAPYIDQPPSYEEAVCM